MRRTSGLGIGTASGSGWSMIASASSPTSTIAANASSWPAVRSSSERSRASGRPVSASATATISSPAARRRAAAPRSRAARLARLRSAPDRWTAAAEATAARTSSGVASVKLRPGSPVPGSTELKVSAMACTLSGPSNEPMRAVEQTNLAPIPLRQRYEEVADRIAADIRAGRLAPGERLPSERELARRLEVGRASVREAIASLQVAGMIDTRPGSGSFVAAGAADRTRETRDSSPSDLLETRALLEPAVARLAAQRGGPDPDIEALLAAMEG